MLKSLAIVGLLTWATHIKNVCFCMVLALFVYPTKLPTQYI